MSKATKAILECEAQEAYWFTICPSRGRLSTGKRP